VNGSEDEGVVGVLETSGVKVRQKIFNLLSEASQVSKAENLSKNICGKDEEIWRDGVPLAESSSAFDMATRSFINKNGESSGVKTGLNPISPTLAQSSSNNGPHDKVPIWGVKRLLKVKLEEESGPFLPMAGGNDF